MGIHLAAALMVAAAASAPTVTTYGDERLAELIREAQENNPNVRRAFAEYQAAVHRVPQAAALPDPSFSVTQYVRAIETRVGPQQRMLAFSQVFPGIGKRAAKGQVAAKFAAERDELHQAERAEIARQVKRVYFEMGFVDRAIGLSREDEELIGHFEELARRRYAQGFGLQADVVRLQAQLTQARNRREQLARQRVDLEASLNSLLDRPADTPVAEVRPGEIPDARLDHERLAEIGRRRRPELRAALLRLEGREKGIQLARRQFRPDFTAGVTWGNVWARGNPDVGMPLPGNGKDVYGVTFGMTLPIFRGKYDAEVREAAESFTAARQAYRSAANGMDSAIRSLSFRIQTIRRQINLMEGTLLPQAEQAFISTESAYSNGALAVISLLDVQRVLLDVRLGLARLRTDYMNALADLERAIGTALPEDHTS